MGNGSSLLIAIGILRAGDSVYVQERRGTGHLDGYWEFPGGKVEPRETPLDAVIREVSEETGVGISGPACLPFWVEHFRYPDRTLELHFYLIDWEARPAISGGCWLLLGELDEAVFPPANREVIRRLKALAR